MRTARQWQPVAGAFGFVIAATVIASCFVGRKSADFECSSNADCAQFIDSRTCEDGYCVRSGTSNPDASGCPADCNGGCDLVAKTCQINCDQPNKCSGTTCPPGYACTINCTANNACSSTLCSSSARSCTITCSQSNACNDVRCGSVVPCTFNCNVMGACGDVTCSTGPCTVNCTAAQACGLVSCTSSCACNVNCPTGGCGAMSCPSPGTTECTKTGLAGAECLSTFAPVCSTCP